MKIFYHPDIENEIIDARDYYESRSAGLGDEFLLEFDKQVNRIAQMPGRSILVRGDLRRVLLKKFPYVIEFRILVDDTIRLTVLKHNKRSPEYGSERR